MKENIVTAMQLVFYASAIGLYYLLASYVFKKYVFKKKTPKQPDPKPVDPKYNLLVEVVDESGDSEMHSITVKIFSDENGKFFGIPDDEGKLMNGSPKYWIN